MEWEPPRSILRLERRPTQSMRIPTLCNLSVKGAMTLANIDNARDVICGDYNQYLKKHIELRKEKKEGRNWYFNEDQRVWSLLHSSLRETRCWLLITLGCTKIVPFGFTRILINLFSYYKLLFNPFFLKLCYYFNSVSVWKEEKHIKNHQLYKKNIYKKSRTKVM